MSIFKRFFSCSNNHQTPVSFSATDRMYIVDATGLAIHRRTTEVGQGNPRDHAVILKNLMKFAAAEDIRLTAVFTGRPLREAADGSVNGGVIVCYADTRDARTKKIIQLVGKNIKKRGVVVLTSDPQVESEAKTLLAQCMRLSTFKKTLESNEIKDNISSRKSFVSRSSADRPKSATSTSVSESDMRDAAVRTLIDPV